MPGNLLPGCLGWLLIEALLAVLMPTVERRTAQARRRGDETPLPPLDPWRMALTFTAWMVVLALVGLVIFLVAGSLA